VRKSRVPPNQTSQHGRDPLADPRGGEVTLTGERPVDKMSDGNLRTSRGPPHLEPLVVPPKVAKCLLACGNETLWRLLHEGELESFLDGASRKITLSSIRSYVERKLATAASVNSSRTQRAVEKSLAVRRAKRNSPSIESAA